MRWHTQIGSSWQIAPNSTGQVVPGAMARALESSVGQSINYAARNKPHGAAEMSTEAFNHQKLWTERPVVVPCSIGLRGFG